MNKTKLVAWRQLQVEENCSRITCTTSTGTRRHSNFNLPIHSALFEGNAAYGDEVMFGTTNTASMCSIMMSAKLFVLFLLAVVVRSDDKIDPRKQAMADISLGMQGLKEAGSDPALLAQLLQDMSVSL
jgi:hypothetical protein